MIERLKLLKSNCDTLSVLLEMHCLTVEKGEAPEDISLQAINSLLDELKEQIEQIGHVGGEA